MSNDKQRTPRTALILAIVIVSISICPTLGVNFNITTPTKSSKSKLISLDEKYKSGVKAYTKDQWSECIRYFEDTIHLNKLYQSVISNCHLKCNELSYDPIVKRKIDDLEVYEAHLRKAKCLFDCHKNGLEDVKLSMDISEEIAVYLAALEPYNYIHMCYYRMNLLPNAASAAFTYLMAHPKDVDMKRNVEYYIRQPEVSKDEVTDLERDLYKVHYMKGVDAYKKNKWAEVVLEMENALADFILSKNKCKAECDVPFIAGRRADTLYAIVDHYYIVFNCEQKCERSVGLPGFDSGIGFIADVLNHLQIAYYHIGNMEEVARAVQSYLSIIPKDKGMLENKSIYSSLGQNIAFTERPDVASYLERDKYEKQLLSYLDVNFGAQEYSSYVDAIHS